MPKAKIDKTAVKMSYSADMVRTYLHEIGRVALLTHEQEIVYGKQVQKMMILLTKKEELEKQQD
jgi:RNA polymerase nonessential primary-like sigma factor